MTQGNRINAMIWQDLAACAGMDTDIFFPRENGGGGERERMRRARAVCRECPVRKDCLEFAIRLDCIGVFGGMTRQERDDYVTGGR